MTIEIFGQTFEPMTDTDYMGFAGASENAMIAYVGKEKPVAMIYEPNTSQVFVIQEDGSETVWTAKEI